MTWRKIREAAARRDRQAGFTLTDRTGRRVERHLILTSETSVSDIVSQLAQALRSLRKE